MLFKLLGLPFSLPIAGLRFCFQQILDLAEAEMNDDTVLKEQLLLLQMRLEEGDIEEDEYVEHEAAIFARLREIRARREQQMREQAAMQAEEEGPVVVERTAGRRIVVETPFDNADGA